MDSKFNIFLDIKKDIKTLSKKDYADLHNGFMTFHLDELGFANEVFSTVKKNVKIFSEFILFCSKNNINHFPYLYIPTANESISKLDDKIQFTEFDEPPSLYLLENNKLKLYGREVSRKIFFNDNIFLVEKIIRFIKETDEYECCLLISKTSHTQLQSAPSLIKNRNN